MPCLLDVPGRPFRFDLFFSGDLWWFFPAFIMWSLGRFRSNASNVTPPRLDRRICGGNNGWHLEITLEWRREVRKSSKWDWGGGGGEEAGDVTAKVRDCRNSELQREREQRVVEGRGEAPPWSETPQIYCCSSTTHTHTHVLNT